MERHEAREDADLPAVTLYRDDIEDIARMMSDAGFKPQFSDHEYAFASLDELVAKRGTQPRTLTLRAADNGPSLTLGRWSMLGTRLRRGYGQEEDQIFARIRELLLRRRRFLARHVPAPTFYSLGFVALLGHGLTLLIPALRPLSSGLFLVSMVFLPLGLLGQMMASGVGTTINLAHRHESTGFWSRNVEKIVAGAIGTVIGLLLKSLYDALER